MKKYIMCKLNKAENEYTDIDLRKKKRSNNR